MGHEFASCWAETLDLADRTWDLGSGRQASSSKLDNDCRML